MNKYNPWVSFLYFFFVIAFSMFFMHPLCLLLSFAAAFIHSVLCGGKKALLFNLKAVFPLIAAAAVANPLINHEGTHILTYFGDGNPLTLESVAYGIAAAFMMGAVICHFSCFNKIMTSDKIMYIVGGIMPSMSLVFSMTLRFVPRFSRQLKKLRDAGKAMNPAAHNNIVRKIQNGIEILSAMITWSLENAVETADSMKSRGYGIKKRTAYSNMIFTRQDAFALFFILVFAGIVLYAGIVGKMSFHYFPSIQKIYIAPNDAVFFASYFLLIALPIFDKFKERLFWRKLKSKI